MTAMYLKELKQFFYTPAAYVIMTVYLLVSGWYFAGTIFLVGLAEMRDFTGSMPFVLAFIIPAVTMRLVAEEKKLGTFELVLSAPMDANRFVFGKFLAVMTLLAGMFGLTLVYVIVLVIAGSPDIGQLVATYVGIMMLASLYASIGLFASSLSESQIIAFIISFTIIFIGFMIERIAPFFPAAAQEVLAYLGVGTHFTPFTTGLIDAPDVAFFLGGTALFLHMARDLVATTGQKG